MTTKADLQKRIDELESMVEDMPTGGSDHTAVLEKIAKLGGHQGALAREALK